MRTDEEYLRDILIACDAIEMFSAGLDRDDFARLDSVSSSILWKLMIIGEAATRISDELRLRYPEVEWNALKGFRNVLVHAYFKINPDLVWDAVKNRIDPLESSIKAIIDAEFPDAKRNDS